MNPLSWLPNGLLVSNDRRKNGLPMGKDRRLTAIILLLRCQGAELP